MCVDWYAHPTILKLIDLAALEVTNGAVVDDRPVVHHALGNFSLEIREVLGAAQSDAEGHRRIKLIATIGGTQAVAEAHGVVVTLGSDNDADPLPSPVADILKDSIVRRIAHRFVMLVCF